MGFRNPITSAAAVDTGQPAGAGARVYQGADSTGVFGVVEFRDGIAGDAPAQLVGRANMVPQGGGGYTQQGGGMALRAGSYNGVSGPEWDVQVEGDPAGGYRGAARLSGAAYVDLGVLSALSADPVLSAFTPTLTAPAGNPVVGAGGKLVGRLRRLGRLCFVQIYLSTGTGFNGGSGSWTFGGLPAAAESDSGIEQHLYCKAFTSAGNFDGFGLLSGTTVLPFLRGSSTDTRLSQVRDATSGTAGTGIPQVAGSYPFLDGNNLTLEGWYVAAAAS